MTNLTKLLLELHQLQEKVHMSPKIMYHGTSDKFLRSILKNGLIPDPKEKTWAEDDELTFGVYTFGAYTGNFDVTRKSVGAGTLRITQPIKYSGGNKILCIFSVIAGEDEIISAIEIKYGKLPDQTKTDLNKSYLKYGQKIKIIEK